MIREPQPCVVWTPADRLVVVDHELVSTQVSLGDKMTMATVIMQGRDGQG